MRPIHNGTLGRRLSERSETGRAAYAQECTL